MLGFIYENVTYSPQLKFLLDVFNNMLPTSYSDTLPVGAGVNYWTTPMYLVVGSIDPYGNKLPLDSQIATQERTLTHYGLNLYDGTRRRRGRLSCLGSFSLVERLAVCGLLC